MADATFVKYKNRRIYDREQSHYVTVEDVRRRIIGGERVETQGEDRRDVTAEVLVQIIESDVHKGRPGQSPTADALRRFIRSYLT